MIIIMIEGIIMMMGMKMEMIISGIDKDMKNSINP
jgi:hypothetical protein